VTVLFAVLVCLHHNGVSHLKTKYKIDEYSYKRNCFGDINPVVL